MKKYTIKWGIWDGTVMSRDIRDEIHAETEQEALNEYKKGKNHFGKNLNYRPWFACLRNNKTNEEKNLI